MNNMDCLFYFGMKLLYNGDIYNEREVKNDENTMFGLHA